MSSIGIYNFVKMVGSIPLSGIEVSPAQKDGVDGTSYKDKGIKGKEKTIITTSTYSNAANAALGKIGYRNDLKGFIATVVDDKGVSWANIMIEDFEIIEEPTIANGVGLFSGATELLITQWTMRALALYY